MKPALYLFSAIFGALYVVPQCTFGNGCDLPSPVHSTPIQTVELTQGMTYRYPYSSFIEVANVADTAGSGHTISFRAIQPGSFKIRIYRDLKGLNLASEGETVLSPTGSQSSNTWRSFFCGPITEPSTNQGLIEIEVVAGSLSLINLYAIEAYGGAMYYSLFDPSLLSVSREPVQTEINGDKALISIGRSTLGNSYSIERSEDLTEWKPESESEIISNGNALIWELEVRPINPQFYRIKETN